jgi:hypothetical protein
MFFAILLPAWVVMNLYIGWRAAAVPLVARHVPRWLLAALVTLLAISYVLARVVDAAGLTLLARPLELAGATWLGVALLTFVTMLAVDVVTAFGFLFRRRAPSLRGWALVAAAILSSIALVQGLRAPVVRDYEVRLAGLPRESDGAVLVFISDLHLGSMLGQPWLAARIAQVSALRPDAIIVGGDVLEGDSPSERELVPALARLSAPLGVWAVAGNHEFYGGGAATLGLLESQGFHVLRNTWTELRPGLVVAGVEPRDSRRESAGGENRIAQALAGRPAGAATILVSHAPSEVEQAAAAGVGLMLAAHTHDGQIWPFRYVIRLQFPFLAGRYEVGRMTLLVCRGTGTFGPRMRLWYPSEILRITLRPLPG